MNPVFIIGGSRTGSELLKNIFRKYSGIDFSTEMCLLCPRWLHRDFASFAEIDACGLGINGNSEKLIELMYSNKLFGYFWSTMSRFDGKQLRDRIEKSDRSLKAIFTILMEEHMLLENKRRMGAKFPVHYSYANQLFEWFPDCQVIHTVRDPKAVYASQSNKYTSIKYSPIKNSWIRMQHYAHINIQSVWASRLHEKLKGRDNYMLSRYEDLIASPGGHLRQICEFLNEPFVADMENPLVYSNSTFSERRGVGKPIQDSAIDSWKSQISPLTSASISIINRKAMRRYGYREPK